MTGSGLNADMAVVFPSNPRSRSICCGRGLSVIRVVAIVVVVVVVLDASHWLVELRPDDVSLVVTTSFWSRLFEPNGVSTGLLKPPEFRHSAGLHSATQLETTALKKTMSDEGNLNASNGANNLCPLESIRISGPIMFASVGQPSESMNWIVFAPLACTAASTRDSFR